jgi:predicted small metal-binding protein
MAKVINCPCGWSVRSESDDDLVSQVERHAKEVHNQTAKREEILAMARPE